MSTIWRGDLNEDCENDDHQSCCNKDVCSLHHLTGGRIMYIGESDRIVPPRPEYCCKPILTCWPSWRGKIRRLLAALRRPWWTAPAGWSASDGTWQSFKCWNGYIVDPLVGQEGENIDSNEADEKAENDCPQDKPNVPAAWADLLKEHDSWKQDTEFTQDLGRLWN